MVFFLFLRVLHALYLSKVLLFWGAEKGTWKLQQSFKGQKAFLVVVYLFKRKFKIYFCSIPRVIQGNKEKRPMGSYHPI